MKKSIHPKIEKCLVNMVTSHNGEHYYYGEFGLYVNFFESKEIPTVGVNFRNFRMNCYWNRKFIDNLDEHQVFFLVIHEFYHLLWNHCERTRSRDHKMANIAQDMVINTCIKDNFDEKYCKSPVENALFIPREYEGLHVFEPLYYWLLDQKSEYDKDKAQCGDGTGNDNSVSKGVSRELKDIFDNYENYEFDHHMGSEISDELRRQIQRDVKNALKNRGLQTSNVEKTLDKLSPKKNNILKEILRATATLKGIIKQRSYQRQNRRGLPIKGKIGKSSQINCILDTSGSMCGEFEHVLSYIFRNDIQINLIQCDTEVKQVKTISNKNELKRVQIEGLGGTTLQPAIEYIKENLPKIPTLVLTDGYTDELDFSGISKTLILTTEIDCPIVIGNARQIKIDQPTRKH